MYKARTCDGRVARLRAGSLFYNEASLKIRGEKYLYTRGKCVCEIFFSLCQSVVASFLIGNFNLMLRFR